VEPWVSDSSADPDLVRAAQGGDREAFGELYRRYGRMVHGVVLARVPRAHAEDLVQDVFVTALDRLRHLRDPAAFGGWLAAIARHRAVDHLRATRDTVEATDALEAPGSDRAEALAVLALLRALPEAYRETLTLRLIEGMTGPEIAARTGLTEGSVRVNLHRGLRLLRERLAGGDRHDG
jgi:RNA polymerase sigma-70 factor (ECF subfamily)